MQTHRLKVPISLGLCLLAATVPASLASAAAAPTRTAFDGAYRGAMNLSPSGRSTRDSNGTGCVDGRPARMTIRNGYVYIRYHDWKRHLLHYRGKVSASGWVDAYHTNRDGSYSILSGQVSNNMLTANMERGPCDYAVTLAKR